MMMSDRLQLQSLIKLFMAFKMMVPLRVCFSTFKKKVMPLRTTGLKSPESLYSSLSAFEAELSSLQLKKMPKTLETFGRKFRRLLRQQLKNTIDVEMQLSQTFEAYTRNVDELIFGTQQQQLQTTLEQMRELTSQMVKFDVNVYLKELIPKSESHHTLNNRFLERFVNIEERVCREIFKGYFGFSRNVSKVAFLQQRQYKGDFRFQLADSLQTIQKGIQVMHHCAMFNKLRDKLALACELAFTNLSSKVSDATMGKLLFCLANSGRSLKFIQENYYQIRERMQNGGFSLELLYYMMTAGMEDQILFQIISKKLVIIPKNAHEQSIAVMMKIILGERYDCQISVQQREEFKRGADKHQGQIFFQHFLERYGYEYSSAPLSLFPYTQYTIQGKHFLVYDSFAVKDESFSLSGAGLIIAQYFLNRSQSVKHINWPRMSTMEKRGQRDEYVLSKFKGIDRPKRIKVRYYQ